METTRLSSGAESALAAKKNITSGSLPAAKSFSTLAFHSSLLVAELSTIVQPLSSSKVFSSST